MFYKKKLSQTGLTDKGAIILGGLWRNLKLRFFIIIYINKLNIYYVYNLYFYLKLIFFAYIIFEMKLHPFLQKKKYKFTAFTIEIQAKYIF